MGVILRNVILGRMLLKNTTKDTDTKDISVWDNVSVK